MHRQSLVVCKVMVNKQFRTRRLMIELAIFAVCLQKYCLSVFKILLLRGFTTHVFFNKS